MTPAQQQFLDWADHICKKYGVSVEIDFENNTFEFIVEDEAIIKLIAEEIDKVDVAKRREDNIIGKNYFW